MAGTRKRTAIMTLALCLAAFCGAAGCTDEAKIERVQKTVIPDCKGKTIRDLTSEMLQNPEWGIVTTVNGRQSVTVRGILAGDKMPAWVRQQKLMQITFSFPLDPKTDSFDPSSLDGFPSLTEPEGVLQAYRILSCS